MENQTPNPIPKKEIEKIPDLNASIRKKSKLRRMFDIFIADDVQDIRSYLVYDLIVPTIRDTVFNSFSSALEMLLYGGRGRKQKSRTPGQTYISYNDYSSSSKPRQNAPTRQEPRNQYENDEIFIPDDDRGPAYSKAKADEVITVINELIDVYGKADVYDVYDAIGISKRIYTNHGFGWVEIINTKPRRVIGGWVIRLPRPVEL